MGKIKKEEIWSIPNCMGYFRILLIPFFCVIYLNADSVKDYYLAAGLVLVSTITDLFDGKVARKFNMVTELGKFVDPFADKLTHGAVALCLCTRYKRILIRACPHWSANFLSSITAQRLSIWPSPPTGAEAPGFHVWALMSLSI